MLPPDVGNSFQDVNGARKPGDVYGFINQLGSLMLVSALKDQKQNPASTFNKSAGAEKESSPPLTVGETLSYFQTGKFEKIFDRFWYEAPELTPELRENITATLQSSSFRKVIDMIVQTLEGLDPSLNLDSFAAKAALVKTIFGQGSQQTAQNVLDMGNHNNL